MRKVLIAVFVMTLFGIDCENSFAGNSNSISYERASRTREKPQTEAFIIWDTGKYGVSEYSVVSNWQNYISKEVNILRFDVECLKRYCKEGFETLDTKIITSFTPIPGNAQNPRGGVIEIPGIRGIVVITNGSVFTIVEDVWDIQQERNSN